MKKRALHSLSACLCVSALASCGSQRVLHFDYDGARESLAVDTSDVHRLLGIKVPSGITISEILNYVYV